MSSQVAPVSELLRSWGRGDVEARDRLLPLVYRELKKRAAAYLRRERRDHMLQPTALVHEAYLELFADDPVAWPQGFIHVQNWTEELKRLTQAR